MNRDDIKSFVNQLFDEGLIDTERKKLAVAKLLEVWLEVKCEQCRKHFNIQGQAKHKIC
jgi:hypothetical protein